MKLTTLLINTIGFFFLGTPVCADKKVEAVLSALL